jgi:hypothetical protein
MATTEIEKLERRYAENPQGLTFAPLAEVHRKSGDIPRALELLKSGLELHPNYIPASIVLGRCYWDQGDLPAAESAFAHVLRLDDENVIALKSLADISERLGRGSEAQRWLKRLISIDRSNEEARQHLARLEGAKSEPVAPVEAASAPSAPAAAPAAEVLPAEPAPAKAIVAEEPAPLDLTAAIADPAQGSPPAPALEFLDTSEPAHLAEPVAQAAAPDPVGADPSPDDQPTQVDGLISQEFVPPKGGGYRLHPELTQDVEPPGERLEQLEVETAAEVELQSSGAAEFRVPNAAEDFMEKTRPPEVPELTIEPPRPAPAPREPTPPPPAPTPARTSYSVRETGGQSVAAFFRAMLSARPAGAAAAGGLQDGKAHPPATQTAPVSPVTPAATPPEDGTVTFDDFFGAAATGSGGAKGSSEAGEDDLDQFQSWLQNLKR